MANPRPLRFIARLVFARQHFPQALCAGCPQLPTCGDLLAHARPGEFWLVRDGGECARAFPASNPPPEVVAVKRHLSRVLKEDLPAGRGRK